MKWKSLLFNIVFSIISAFIVSIIPTIVTSEITKLTVGQELYMLLTMTGVIAIVIFKGLSVYGS